MVGHRAIAGRPGCRAAVLAPRRHHLSDPHRRRIGPGRLRNGRGIHDSRTQPYRGRSPERDVEPVLRLRPRAEVAPLRLVDLPVVDAGLPPRHQALRRELPQLVAIAAVPLTGSVVALVLEAHRDPVLPEVPQALAQHVVQFALPFAGEERDDLLTTDDVLVTVSPVGVDGVGEADLFGVAGVPGVFGGLNLLQGGLECEWWERRSALCHALFLRPTPDRDSLLQRL